MRPLVFSGSSHPKLAQGVADALGLPLGRCVVDRFPDGEHRIALDEDVRGADVYLVQSTPAPAGEYLLELFLMADTCRRGGAARVTAVVPYFAYARQDRRVHGNEPLGARVVADLMGAARLDRLVTLDLHSASVEACFAFPVEHLSAATLLAGHLSGDVVKRASVVVAPDVGAVKLAERYAQLLKLPVVAVQKQRVSGSEVKVRGISGEVKGTVPIVVDDMISTGGTVEGAIQAVLAEGAVPEVTVVVSHALLVDEAEQRLSALPVRRLVSTDSVPQRTGGPLHREVQGIAALVAERVKRLVESAR